eukprot:TRINITY_DN5088_c0_g2_i5.p1 TRINITY_DN5088_c0_g2~~TRINITY_DN5088_c0_g2_i5.p1  ORF type:complete len:479 (-),score=69.18 TRINITY_DN5088_c0_g2_i5:6-1376(-)
MKSLRVCLCLRLVLLVTGPGCLAAGATSQGGLETSCGSELLSNWLYDRKKWSPPGYHVLCVVARPAASGSKNDYIEITLWVGGHGEVKPVRWQMPASTTVKTFRKELKTRARMKTQDRWKVLPWALMDVNGNEITSSPQGGATEKSLLLAFEGGRWVWPGIREGFERRVELPELDDLQAQRNVTLKTLTLHPLSFTLEDFAAAEDAKHIIDKIKPGMQPTGVNLDDNSKGRVDDEGGLRTCSENFVRRDEDIKLKATARRTAALTRMPLEMVEDYRALEYKPGQRFVAHTDYYDPVDFQEQPEILSQLRDGRNWLVTMYIYLSTVKRGGETYFPRAYGGDYPQDLGECKGPAVKPKRGRALMFYSLHPDSTANPYSLHGACKVDEGVKYTVNLWVWNQPKTTGRLDSMQDAGIPLSKGISCSLRGFSARTVYAAWQVEMRSSCTTVFEIACRPSPT